MVKDMQRRDPVQARVAQDAMDAKGGKQERLDAVIEEGVAAARGVLEAGSTLGILFAKLDENLAQSAIRIPVEDVPATAGERREMMEALAAELLTNAAGYIVVTEGWTAPPEWMGLPSACPDRGEVIIVQVETRAGSAGLG